MTFPFRPTLGDFDLCDGAVEDSSLVFSFDEVFLERLQEARRIVLKNLPWKSAVVLRLRDVEENVDLKVEAHESVEIYSRQERFVVSASTVRFECMVINDDFEPAVSANLNLEEIVAACKPPLFHRDGDMWLSVEKRQSE